MIEDTTEGLWDPEQHEEILLPESAHDLWVDFGGEG